MTNYGAMQGAVERGEMLALAVDVPAIYRCANCNGTRLVVAWEPTPGVRRKMSATAEGDKYFTAEDFDAQPRWFAGAGWYAGRLQFEHCPVCSRGGR